MRAVTELVLSSMDRYYIMNFLGSPKGNNNSSRGCNPRITRQERPSALKGLNHKPLLRSLSSPFRAVFPFLLSQIRRFDLRLLMFVPFRDDPSDNNSSYREQIASRVTPIYEIKH